METKQLKQMLHSINCSHSVVVIPADGLLIYTKENMPPVGFVAIVNTDPSTDVGEHWVCIEVLSKYEVSIFDSLASDQHVSNKYIKVFRELFPKLEKNNGLLQDPFSSSCGMFCIYFFHFRCNEKMSLQSIIANKFSDDITYNECTVLLFISERYDSNLYSNVKSTCNWSL
jgi:hypothetical protein